MTWKGLFDRQGYTRAAGGQACVTKGSALCGGPCGAVLAQQRMCRHAAVRHACMHTSGQDAQQPTQLFLQGMLCVGRAHTRHSRASSRITARPTHLHATPHPPCGAPRNHVHHPLITKLPSTPPINSFIQICVVMQSSNRQGRPPDLTLGPSPPRSIAPPAPTPRTSFCACSSSARFMSDKARG